MMANSVERIRASVFYIRVPGLLTLAARTQSETPASVPLVITEGRVVRDACPLARSQGIRDNQLVTHARRLCPWLLSGPQENLDRRYVEALSRRLLLGPLTDVTPIIEPAGEDATWADLSGCPVPLVEALPERLTEAIAGALGMPPIIGVGPSRLAARTCAECKLLPEDLGKADAARWLWPEDPAIGARLARLGLPTFADVAGAGETALVHVFGAKQGRLLHRRAATGQDFAPPIRALYPPPVVTVSRNCAEEPVANRQALEATLAQMVESAASEIRQTSLFARRIALSLRCEDDSGEHRTAWMVPIPVQTARDLQIVVPVLLRRLLPALRTPITRITLTADDLTLPTAASGDLFAAARARRKEQIALTRRLLTERHGPKALRRLSEIPVSLRETRRSLVREGYLQP